MNISIVKNFILLGDAFQSVQLLLWRDVDHSLHLIAKDYEDHEVYASQFVVDTPAVGMLAFDGEKNMQVA